MRAFDSCHSLSCLKLPEQLEEIERFSFYCCDRLEKIWFPDYLQKLRAGAFERCDQLRIISVSSYTDVEQEALPPHALIEMRSGRNEDAARHVAEGADYLKF